MKRIDFVSEVLKRETTIGAILPSSRSLVRKMLAKVNFKSAGIIVEFGPGNGIITKEIIRRKNPETRLIIFEVNPDFFKYLKATIGDRKDITIYNRSADLLTETLHEEGIDKADYIISSVPLIRLPKTVSENIILSAHQMLKDGGLFIQFQYSLMSQRKLKNLFKDVKTNFAAINMPPAFIYICTK
ncbi:MAG: methyltransferase [Chitinophagales bacterium]|nr:methyltransferase [Chitinophagales bacterium]